MAKYLQLAATSLQCVKMTENRAYAWFIPLETDPDSIDVSTILTDGQQGVVVNHRPVFLGNRYNSGHTERFASPKPICEVLLQEGDTYPRRVGLTINMAEKDDGAGFYQLTDQIATELTDELSDWAEREIGGGGFENVLIEQAAVIAGDLAKTLFKEIGSLLGLGDDPLLPQSIVHKIESYNQTPPSDEVVLRFREPNPAHKGEFILKCKWQIADSSAFLSSTAAVVNNSAGSASANLTDTQLQGAQAYSGGHRKARQFAQPVPQKDRSGKAVTPNYKMIKLPIKKPYRNLWIKPILPISAG